MYDQRHLYSPLMALLSNNIILVIWKTVLSLLNFSSTQVTINNHNQVETSLFFSKVTKFQRLQKRYFFNIFVT